MRRRGIAGTALAAVLAAGLLIGCGPDPDPDATTTTPTPTTPTTLDNPTAAIRAELDSLGEQLSALPVSMAETLTTYILQVVTPEQVESAAMALCASGYNPEVTISWLQRLTNRGVNFLLVGPATRLRITAENRCGEKATPAQVSRYVAGINRFFGGVGGVMAPPPTSISQASSPLCQFLSSNPGESVITSAVTDLLSGVSGGRVRGQGSGAEAIAKIVGASCPSWLPAVISTIQKALGGS